MPNPTAPKVAITDDENEFPTPEQCNQYRIDMLRKVCPSAIPYVTYATKESESKNQRLLNWREGFTHVLNMLWWKVEQEAALAASPQPSDERVRLFRVGQFTGHSGDVLPWKIECDALTDNDWEAIATICAPTLPPFSHAVGVPRGGLKLAEKMNKYNSGPGHPTLIVDDVLTTGSSLLGWAKAVFIPSWFGFVAFARGPLPENVHCFLTVSPNLTVSRSRDSAIRAEAMEEVRQHIAWLNVFVREMSSNNWRDMQDRCATQLHELEGAIFQPKPECSGYQAGEVTVPREAFLSAEKLVTLYDRVHSEIERGAKWQSIDSGTTDPVTYGSWLAYMQQRLILTLKGLLLSAKITSPCTNCGRSKEGHHG